MGRCAHELEQTMSYVEFIEHLADNTIEPWDESRGDVQTAQIVSTLANLHRARGAASISIEDCVLKFEQPTEQNENNDEQVEKTVQQLEAFFARYDQNYKSLGC